MTNISVQPLALVHNNEVVCIEKNEQVIERNFSSFKIFKLKGPIDTDYLLNIIFPSSEKNCYDLEISEYNGQSAKVKFYFTNRTHTDLITQLQRAAAGILNVSENGLSDWLASDTVTFKTIYQNTDLEAVHQQLRNDDALSSDDDDAASSSSSLAVDLQLYPIVDEEAFERELQELSRKISSQTSLTSYDLQRLFRKTFGRRDMSVTFKDVYDEYFSQIQGVVGFVTGPTDVKLIEDGLALNPNTIIYTFAGILFQHTEKIINAGTLGVFAKDYKLGIYIALWNLINAFHSIHVSYKELIKVDEEFKQVLLSKKSDFGDCLLKIDQILMDVLDIISNELDKERYRRLQRRFGDFIRAAETLMKLVMDINNKCNEKLEKLENQEKDLSTKLWTAAFTFAVSAMVIGGTIYYKSGRLRKYGTYAGGMLTGTAAATMIAGNSAKKAVQDSIEHQSNMLIQLQLTYSKLEEWKNLSHDYVDHDIDDINNNRTTLIEKFVRVRLQCKSLHEIFDLV